MPKFHTGDWAHRFIDDRSDRMTQIVLDVDQQQLVAATVQRDRAADVYTAATREEFADLQDSVINANAELFDGPATFGLIAVDDLPTWAVYLVQ